MSLLALTTIQYVADDRICLSKKSILSTLSLLADEQTLSCVLKKETLGLYARVGKTALKKHLGELEKLGALAVVKQRTKSHKQAANKYILTFILNPNSINPRLVYLLPSDHADHDCVLEDIPEHKTTNIDDLKQKKQGPYGDPCLLASPLETTEVAKRPPENEQGPYGDPCLLASPLETTEVAKRPPLYIKSDQTNKEKEIKIKIKKEKELIFDFENLCIPCTDGVLKLSAQDIEALKSCYPHVDLPAALGALMSRLTFNVNKRQTVQVTYGYVPGWIENGVNMGRYLKNPPKQDITSGNGQLKNRTHQRSQSQPPRHHQKDTKPGANPTGAPVERISAGRPVDDLVSQYREKLEAKKS